MISVNKIFSGLFLLICSLVVYLFVSGKFGWNLEKTNFAYFNLLADSFSSRRYDLIHPPANPFDLSVYHGAIYLPWGPLPAVMLMPFVKLFGINVSDRVYTSVFGGINVLAFYFVLIELQSLFKSKLTNIHISILTIFFAFGTVHFASSVIARVWFTSQIMSLTIHIFSLYFLLKFVKNRHVLFFMFSFGFLVLSIMGRLWYVMMIPMYVYAFWMARLNRKQYLFVIIGLFFVSIIAVRMYGVYNFRRFGSFFETGYTYQQEAKNFLQARNTYGRYSYIYVVKNVWYQLLNPIKIFEKTFPFIKPDPIGNGILLTSPMFLLVFFIKKAKKHKHLLTLFAIGTIPYVVQLMFFFGTGFKQFGARYLLDVIPLLILILALVIPYVEKRLMYALFAVSIAINSLGAVWLVFNY